MYLIIPVKDKKPRDPSTMKPLSQNGITVHKVSSYWKNRKNDGDVTIKDTSTKKKGKVENGN